jgi:hypothetical protein
MPPFLAIHHIGGLGTSLNSGRLFVHGCVLSPHPPEAAEVFCKGPFDITNRLSVQHLHFDALDHYRLMHLYRPFVEYRHEQLSITQWTKPRQVNCSIRAALPAWAPTCTKSCCMSVSIHASGRTTCANATATQGRQFETWGCRTALLCHEPFYSCSWGEGMARTYWILRRQRLADVKSFFFLHALSFENTTRYIA